MLHPDVVLREDFGAARRGFRVHHGVEAVTRQTGIGARMEGANLVPALVNGAPGVVVTMRGRPFAVMGFTVSEGKIAAIDVFADPERIGRIPAPALDLN